MSKIPYIGEVNGIKTLFVDDRPFFVRGGELHNSSSSSLEYMEEKVWPMLRGLNMNTVVLPVAWENIEPTEGGFDFSLVDGLLDQARREGMKLVILWFGLWKNSESNYVPMWVKRNYETYWRAENAKGDKLNIISPFCKAAVEKDALAFGKLLEHLKDVDSEDNTVIFLQVENEIGVLHSERDFSAGAESLFQSAVPEDIKTLFDGDERFPANMDGQSWPEVFGENACEMFMCWAMPTRWRPLSSRDRDSISCLCMPMPGWSSIRGVRELIPAAVLSLKCIRSGNTARRLSLLLARIFMCLTPRMLWTSMPRRTTRSLSPKCARTRER